MARGALKRIRTAALRFGLVTLLLVRDRCFVLCRRRFLQKVDQICESNEEKYKRATDLVGNIGFGLGMPWFRSLEKLCTGGCSGESRDASKGLRPRPRTTPEPPITLLCESVGVIDLDRIAFTSLPYILVCDGR